MPNLGLDEAINAGDAGHIATHDILADKVNPLFDTWLITGNRQGLLSGRPSDLDNDNVGFEWWSTDVQRKDRWNGTSWDEGQGNISSVFNIKDAQFGAVGDGIVDDTAAIQAAIDAADAGGGGIVFFPAGTYRVTSSLAHASYTMLWGPGWCAIDYFNSGDAATLLADGAGVLVGAPIVDVSGIDTASVVGLNFRQSDHTAVNTTVGIGDPTSPGYRVRVEWCMFQRFGGNAISLRGNVNNVNNILMRHCSGDGVHLEGHDNVVQNCDIGGEAGVAPTTGSGIYISGANSLVQGNRCFLQENGIRLDGTAQGNRILGNRCEKHSAYGIVEEDEACYANLIEHNHTFQNGVAGIAVLGGDSGAGAARATTIVGNLSQRFPGLSGTGSGYDQPIGILVEKPRVKVTANQCYRNIQGIVLNTSAAKYCQVTDNAIDSSDHESIVLVGACDNQISGNWSGRNAQATANTYDHISVDGSSHRNTIEHNTCRHEGTGNKARYAVNVAAGALDNCVRLNDLRDSVTSGNPNAFITDAGTRTIVADNLPFSTRSYFDPRALRLDGTLGGYASTPDTSAAHITGDIDIRVACALADWTPATDQNVCDRWTASGNQRAWNFKVIATTGVLQLQWSPDGSASVTAQSTVAPTLVDWQLRGIRVTLDVDDGSGNYVVKFWTKFVGRKNVFNDLKNDTWTQLGATVTVAGPTSIYAATSIMVAGGDFNPVTGKIHAVIVEDGILGTVVANPDFTRLGTQDVALTADSGDVWTLAAPARVEAA